MSPIICKNIVKPEHRAVIVLNNFLTFSISTSVWVKNSSLGCHSTRVPVWGFPVCLSTLLCSKIPSLNLTCSYWPSLKVVTFNQCDK